MAVDILTSLFSPSLSQLWRSCLSTLGATGEKWVSPAMSWVMSSRALTHCSPLAPVGRATAARQFSPVQCGLGRAEGRGSGVVLGKFLLWSPLQPNPFFFFFFTPMARWNLSLERLDFYKISLVHGYFSVSALISFFPNHSKRN